MAVLSDGRISLKFAGWAPVSAKLIIPRPKPPSPFIRRPRPRDITTYAFFWPKVLLVPSTTNRATY